MSLITNRKRPRGFSDTFDPARNNTTDVDDHQTPAPNTTSTTTTTTTTSSTTSSNNYASGSGYGAAPPSTSTTSSNAAAAAAAAPKSIATPNRPPSSILQRSHHHQHQHHHHDNMFDSFSASSSSSHSNSNLAYDSSPTNNTHFNFGLTRDTSHHGNGSSSNTTLMTTNSGAKNADHLMSDGNASDVRVDDNDVYIIDDGEGDDDVDIEGASIPSQQLIEEEEEEDEDEGEEEEDDDDVIILEERQIEPPRIGPKQRARRNNSDSVLSLDRDAFAAYNMFNVNNTTTTSLPQLPHPQQQQQHQYEQPLELSQNRYRHFPGSKKQRTNSLPQLPQAKCFYNKIPSNYILQHAKMGEVRADIIPHKLNLPPCDDKDGHYVINIKDTFANRFVIVKLLGQGTFGKVVECYDRVNRETVAVKIIRNIPKYRDAARIELRILSTLKKFDNENLNHCIHLRECFDFRGHICIVTDLLKISLYDFLERNKFIPYPGSHIQAISKQLIRSVTFFHDLNLIHTDLKPENILLHDDSYFRKPLCSSTIIFAFLHLNFSSTTPNQTAFTNNQFSVDSKWRDRAPKATRILKDPLIQIIDFGSAIFDDEYHSSIVSTRHYRAPEIVLGVGWSFPCDIWSVGCILVELVIGEPLFRTHDNLEHLAMIEKVCGQPIDRSMVKSSKRRENECGLKYFTNDYTRTRSHDDDSFESDEDDDGQQDDDPDGDDDEDDNDSDVIIDDEPTADRSFKLIFPTASTPDKFIENVAQLDRIDRYISRRIGLDIDFDYTLSENYSHNRNLINFGNFTFWWFFIDLLKKLFVINPRDRLTALEAMDHPWFNLGIEDEGTL